MKRKIFAAHPRIRNTLLVLVVITVALFVVLKIGISIDRLKIGSFSIERLYLKLNKKLLLSVDKLIIPTNKKRQELPDPKSDLDMIKNILRYFETVELKEVKFKNNNYSILYADQVFYMSSDLFEIATHQIDRDGDKIRAIVDLFYIKKYDVRFEGKFVYDYKRDTGLLRGKVKHQDMNADFIVNKKLSNIYYMVKSNEFGELKSLVQHIEMSRQTHEWIEDKIKAKSYRLKQISGVAQVSKGGIKMLLDTISGEAVLQDVSVEFKSGVDPVLMESAKVIFDRGELYFNFVKPHFDEYKLSGSNLSISNLINSTPDMLHLDLKFDAPLNSKIKKILQAYDIDIPITQKSGTTKSQVKLDINLRTDDIDYLCDLKLGKGEIVVADATIPISKGLVVIKKGKAILSKINLSGDMLQGSLNGEVDFKTKVADLNFDIEHLYLGTPKEHYLSMKQTKIPVNIDYNNNISIELPTLKTNMRTSNSGEIEAINISDLSLFSDNLQGLPVTINGGWLNISVKNDSIFSFEGSLMRSDCFLYEDESQCLTKILISGSYSDDALILKAFQDRFVYNSKLSLITLKNINFDLKKFLDSKDKKSKTDMQKKLKVVGINSVLRYKKSKLLTDKYTLGIMPGGDFHFRGALGGDSVSVTKKANDIDVKADRIGDRMLHPLINFSGLQQGHYSVNIKGDSDKKMVGTIILDGGVMSDFKAYNNVLAFINTVPALATLSSPGFSTKGFKIIQGVVKFTITDGHILKFDSILIEGKSATISGDGFIDLDSEKIDVDLAIQTAKVVGNIVGSLPVVGYILTGEDKSIMTVGLHIDGTLDEPTTHTSTVKDILLLPFKMIKRTLQGEEKR